jgi:NADPH-dependent 2,4-dienoyl-CoA reductase/sulfur reductase-like enzyme/two-component sensor histidine kinase/rhodanese-related sulfurtransferase
MKAPVHAIQSLLQAMSDAHGQEVPPSVRDVLDRVMSRAREAGQLVDDLLEYESYEGRKTGEHREFELVSLVSDLALRLSLGATARDVSINVSHPENLAIFVSGIRTGVEHAIRNLIDNAVKYSPPLGQVQVNLSLDAADETARISIRDTGGGIPEAEIANLFTPFFRSKSNAATTGGTGLGLAIAARIVEAHEGSIEVDSEEGRGTTFTIVLPCRRTEQVPESNRRRRIVIVGGVTSGPKTASRLRRLDEELDITIVERNEFLSYSGCQLPFFISDTFGSPGDPLSSAHSNTKTAHFFNRMKNITVLNLTAAEEIDRVEKRVKVRREKDGTVFHVPYDVLVLATGSVPVAPSIPGAASGLVFPLHSLEDAKRIKDRLGRTSAQDVIIIGGGLIGVSIIQSLLAAGARVTLLEREQAILSSYFDADFSGRIQNELTRKGVKVATGTMATSVTPEEDGVRVHAAARSFSGEFVILSSGMRPNSTLAGACGLALGKSGGVQVDEHLRTSDPDIFAVGDCAETNHLLTGKHEYWPLGAISMKMGHTAADVIAGKNSVYRGSLGTVLLRCIDLRIARTGITSTSARAAGFDPVSFVLTGPDRPVYALESADIYLKVIADRGTRKILGAQAFGRGEVSPKISLLAAAIANGMTTDEMFVLDLGHAPEFNHPTDVVQTACMMLNNKIEGLVETITATELDGEVGRFTLAAIGAPDSSSRYLIPGSVEISPENLRKDQLPFREDEHVVLYSRTSMEAYQAYRYLSQREFRHIRVLEGGYLFWAD